MAVVAELAVSNICWPDGAYAQEEAVRMLSTNLVTAIDVAPGKAFPEMATVGPDGIDRDELVAFRRTLRHNNHGVTGAMMRIAGFQAVTFGRKESIFSDDTEQVAALQEHMGGIIRLAEFVGAQTIVYGSAGTRLTGELDDERTYERAAEFFAPLGSLAHDSGVVLGIEPVSTTWTGGQAVFGRTGREVVDFAARLKTEQPGSEIKFVPDSFAMADGDGNIARVIELAAEWNKDVLAPHAQIAELGMVPHAMDTPIGESHRILDDELSMAWVYAAANRERNGAPLPTLAIEMFAVKDETIPLATRLERTVLAAVFAARKHYSRSLGRYVPSAE